MTFEYPAGRTWTATTDMHRCPLCRGAYVIAEPDDGGAPGAAVVHSTPMCAVFDRLSASDYVDAVEAATSGDYMRPMAGGEA